MDYETLLEKQLGLNSEFKTTLKYMNDDIKEVKKEIKMINDKLTNMRLKNAALYGGLSVVLSLGVTLITLLISGVFT